jgi:hypothetical protein
MTFEIAMPVFFSAAPASGLCATGQIIGNYTI